jgi:hypothetical protein
MASNFPIQVMGGYSPDRIRYIPVKAAESFIAGAMVKLTSGEAEECGADPSAWLGIALAPASLGLATAGSPFGDSRGTKMIPVFLVTPADTLFIASATTPVQATHLGVAYGVVKSTNWLLDISETSATIFEVYDVSNSPQQEGFFVRALASRLTVSSIAS